MGHPNVAVYNEGLSEWVRRGYPVQLRKVYPDLEVPVVAAAELKRILESGARLLVLDVRHAEDARAGRIPGAINVDLEELAERISEVPPDRKVVVVDHRGEHAAIAGRFLASRGYRDVALLDGGFLGGWVRAGYPVAR